MRIMKKRCLVLLAAFAFFALFPPTVFAAGAKLTVATAEAEPGDVVTLAVDMTDNPGFCYLKLNYTYDREKLEFVRVDNGTVSTDSFIAAGDALSWDTANDAAGDGTLFRLIFSVKENAAGTAAVALSVAGCFNYDEQEVAVAVANGAVNIKGVHTHTWDEGTPVRTATCKEEGLIVFICTQCGEIKTEATAVNPANHYGGGTELKGAKPATESENGYTGDRVCKGCGAVLEKGSEIPKVPAGHTHTLTVNEAQPPTCTTDGALAHYSCSVCGRMFRDAEGTEEISSAAIPTASHAFGDWTVTSPASETEDGERIRECEICRATEKEVIPAIG